MANVDLNDVSCSEYIFQFLGIATRGGGGGGVAEDQQYMQDPLCVEVA